MLFALQKCKNPYINLFKTSLSFWLPWFKGNSWPFTENTKPSHFILNLEFAWPENKWKFGHYFLSSFIFNLYFAQVSTSFRISTCSYLPLPQMDKTSSLTRINLITVHPYLAVKILLLTIFKILAKISGMVSGNQSLEQYQEKNRRSNSSQLTCFHFLSYHVVHATCAIE